VIEWSFLEEHMITRLTHVCLSTADLEKSIEYYGKLGFTPVFRLTRGGRPYGVYLKISDSQFIEIFEDRDMEKPVNTGILHFCLETENLDGLIADLDSKGVEHTEKKLGCDNTWQIWLTDPDGNSFEIHSYTEKSAQFSGGTIEADW
jgi:lactoylglutathione lyase/glyoxylase I family protein